jgi:HD-GYP domain-containing protein (c-di-GMP phosphodiesterase class II)
MTLGMRMGLPKADQADLYVAGVLHDLGKINLPDLILHKQGPLSDEEYETVKQHPIVGEALLTHVEALEHLRPLVRHHHERYDGLGYPDGLMGTKIPLLARIMAVADALDAMNSDRPYRKALSRELITQRLHAGAGHAWDPDVVSVALKCRDEIFAAGKERAEPSTRVAVVGRLSKYATPKLAPHAVAMFTLDGGLANRLAGRLRNKRMAVAR